MTSRLIGEAKPSQTVHGLAVLSRWFRGIHPLLHYSFISNVPGNVGSRRKPYNSSRIREQFVMLIGSRARSSPRGTTSDVAGGWNKVLPDWKVTHMRTRAKISREAPATPADLQIRQIVSHSQGAGAGSRALAACCVEQHRLVEIDPHDYFTSQFS